ncbi:MAG: T9SS type A sorting domain-containing protein [Bacteroidetes bacterium]|nr:T9SS type A sorting domain-containing protein [Bacteroidota bacterium]
MKIKLQISIFLLLTSFLSNASHYIQGEINYVYLGNEKYEIRLLLRRDCRAVGLPLPSYTLKCENTGKTKSLSLTLFSIKEVTELCKSASKQCNPPNTYGTGNGVEDHLYVDTIDFGGADSAFASCCTLSFHFGACCRMGSITTGGQSYNFYIYSFLERCKAKQNSSPVFLNIIPTTYTCNNPLKISYLATDADGDSLSYSLVNPLSGWYSSISWNKGFSAKMPLTPYYPAGYNKSKGPNPNNNPPIGLYFDSLSGFLITTPTDCNEFTNLAVKVEEWRKDSAGKYNKIGAITKDMALAFVSSNNNTPLVTSNTKSPVSACGGEKITFNVFTSDNAFKPTPPGKPILNDTVKLIWNNPINNSSIKLDSSYVKQQSAIFEWTPNVADTNKLPFHVSFKAIDNACNYSSSSYYDFSIKVYPKIKISNTINKINSNVFALKINIGNKKYPYMVTNNVKTSYPYDTRAFYFKSSKQVTSDLENDTVVFLKNGTFIINQFFISNILCNQQTISDTVTVSNLIEASISNNSDTTVCNNINTNFYCKTYNAQKPITFTWKTKNTTQIDTLGYFSSSFTQPDTVFVSIKDANGQVANTWVKIKIIDLPQINAGEDKTICVENQTQLVVKNINRDTLTWKWTFNKAFLSNKDTLIANAEGLYIAWGTNKYKCTNSDTVKLSHFVTERVSLISGRYCQGIKSIKQNEIFTNDPNIFPVLQWSTLKPLKDNFGNSIALNKIVFDEDLGAGYKYLLYFGNDLVDLDTLWEDSLKYIVKAWDKNNCLSIDTATISIIKMPEIEFGLPNYSICRNDTLNLNNLVITKGTKSWFPINNAGFEQWPIPVSTEINNGFLKPKFFKPSGGKYQTELISKYDKCFEKDTFDLIIFPNPVPVLNYATDKDSIIILDNSLHTDFRKWYLNGTAKGTGKSIVFSKTDIDKKPIKLELGNSYSCYADTVFFINNVNVAGINKSNIKIYPNPAIDYLHVHLFQSVVNAKWNIIDITGKTILKGEITGFESTLKISKLKAGFYYLNIFNNDLILSVPFIKIEN